MPHHNSFQPQHVRSQHAVSCLHFTLGNIGVSSVILMIVIGDSYNRHTRLCFAWVVVSSKMRWREIRHFAKNGNEVKDADIRKSIE